MPKRYSPNDFYSNDSKWENIDPNSPGSHNPDIIYTIITIEGKEWLATKGAYGYWYLSGPLNVLTIEKDMINDAN